MRDDHAIGPLETHAPLVADGGALHLFDAEGTFHGSTYLTRNAGTDGGENMHMKKRELCGR